MKPDDFLLAYHAVHTGITSRVLGGGRLADGRSSYELLAGLPRAGDTVLDLGCGDGYLLEQLIAHEFPSGSLVGVDMSSHELVAARQRPELAGVGLVRAQADHLPLADASVDCVLSHLAFMLMSDIETVAGQIARVLRPGGLFANISGGGPVVDDERDGFLLFLRLFGQISASALTPAPRIGDKRTRSAEGVAELLPAEFRVVDEGHELCFDGSAEAIWQVVSTIYETFMLKPEAAEQLREQFLVEAGPGVVRCRMRLRCVVAEKIDGPRE